MEGNICDQGVIVCHLATCIVYGMHQIFGMHVVCFSCFYFVSFQEFSGTSWMVDLLID